MTSGLAPILPVLLTGPPAVGKSTLGPLLADRLGLPFIDLDHAVAVDTGLARDDLFARGEVFFREAERRVLTASLDACAEGQRAVIAVGGGTLVDERLRRRALESAIVLGLTSSRETLLARAALGSRPLLPSATLGNALDELLRARSDVYADVHASFEVAGDAATACETIASALTRGILPIAPCGVRSHAAWMVDDLSFEATLRAMIDRMDASSITVVTDDNVARFHEAVMRSVVPEARWIVRPAGEMHKNWSSLEQVLVALAEAGVDREGVLVGFGGGVTTDVTGLAAALHARGIRWIAIPTSLMGMVDAATGGKTAVNLGSSKNGVGAFHHPRAVIVNPGLSRTEDDRAVRAALAEVIKVACVRDADLFEWLDSHRDALARRDEGALRHAVRRALAVKTRVVNEDPDEAHVRRLLNFGHTFGHALEAATQYERWLHGEAVAIGMLVALRVGEAVGVTPRSAVERVSALIRHVCTPELGLDRPVVNTALGELFRDKKRAKNGIRFILLREIGFGLTHSVKLDELRNLIECAAAEILCRGAQAADQN